MVTTDDVLKRVIELRIAHAEAALSKPKERDAFEYGKQVGLFLGFEKVREEIKRLLEEDANSDRLTDNDDRDPQVT